MKRSMLALFCFVASCGPIGGDAGNGHKADVGDNPLGLIASANPDGTVRLQLPPLDANQQLYLRLRRGHWNTLDCTQMVGEVAPIDPSDPVLHVDPALLAPFYGPEWQSEPTDEMIASAEAGTDAILDTCLVRDGAVEQQVETDFMVAWDHAIDSSPVNEQADSVEQPVHSAQKYAELCVKELGEIPFFQKLADGKYSTYSCMDSTPIPMTVTDANGMVTSPPAHADKCDKPEYIYSMCEQGPRVAHRTNEDGTHWVLLCRKSQGGLSSSTFNDIAMIGHNPLTGKTCFFQNALYDKTDGAHVPHPADVEKSANLWSGVHGGLGSGIECSHCHDNDPFIHSPWIDGALDAQGHPVVPKMGVDPDFALGYNDGPYSIVNLKGQGWTMEKQLVSPEAAACTKCHRIGSGRWLEWTKRLDGSDDDFKQVTSDAYLAFDKLHWMPPDLRTENITEANWADSKYAKALKFIQSCRSSTAGCKFAPIPDSP
jgi:hypothetical protein